MSLALLLVAGGCSYRLESISRARDDDITTGSIRQTAVRSQPLPQAQANSTVPGDRELAATRTAVSEALAKGGRDTSVPWEDPATGARGTVTPLSNASSQGGATCRDFLASYVRDGSEAWLQGEACRGPNGRWEVRQMRPWRRT
jgi:surface antigen